jgi:DNA-binding HxlR family transcriptional regulator
MRARRYHQFCGLARALDVVGERWTLLIVRDLLLGPRRYGELLERLPGITTNLLAKRLRELVEAGLLEKVTLPPPASTEAYALTQAGAALEPAVMALAGWGGRYMDKPRRDDRVDVGWALLSLKRRYRGGGGGDRVVQIRVGERSFALRLLPDSLEVKERVPDRPDAIISLGVAELREALFTEGGRSLAKLARARAVEIEGDPSLLEDALRPLDGG